jgi:ADP-heptose:LPS heptosyltransferase
MATPRHGSAAPRTPRIVVFRALPGLGDFLCVVPTLRALRRAHGEAEIHLVGLRSTRLLALRFGRYVDRFHAFPGHPALPEQPAPSARDAARFLGRMRSLDADVAIQLHGSGETVNDVVASFGARVTAGFHRPGQPCPDPDRFLEWDDAEPEIRRGLRLLAELGLTPDEARPVDERLEFPLAPAAARNAGALLEPLRGRPYAVVHPGSARPASRWEVDGFAAVIRRLRADGLGIALTGGPGEVLLTRTLADDAAAVGADGTGVVDLAGHTGLDELGWVVRGARLVVANDTGISHVAAALDVPSVVVFPGVGPDHVRRWAPLDDDRHVAVPGALEAVVAATGHLLHATGTAA